MRHALLLRRPTASRCLLCTHFTPSILRIRRQLSSATSTTESASQPQPPAQLRLGRKDSESRRAAKPWEAPNTPCRTRFAPSPTGYLHLGSLRTALFNFLLAKRTGGQFVLRIEDTDRRRTVHDAEKRLFEDLKWAGLSWDEGPDVPGPYGPYRQSERLPLYHDHAKKLLEEGRAYRCFCTHEELDAYSRLSHESGQPTHYPGTCRSISPEESEERASKGESFAIRFKSPEKPTMIRDIVYGNFKKKQTEDDFIIIKTDGFPTYHFANVVDDKHMEITHVIRGAEWLISTPKHVDLYNAFGWQPPQFAHVGLLVNKDHSKLSKRSKGADMSFYKDNNILPSALLNFTVLLGWSRDPKLESDFLTLQQMIDNFSLKFTKGDIMVDFPKLDYLQNKAIRHLHDTSSPTWPSIRDSYLIEPLSSLLSSILTTQSTGQTTITLSPELSPSAPSSPAQPIPLPLSTLRTPVPALLSPSTLHTYLSLILSTTSHFTPHQSVPFLLKHIYLFFRPPSFLLSSTYPIPSAPTLAFTKSPSSPLHEVLSSLWEKEFAPLPSEDEKWSYWMQSQEPEAKSFRQRVDEALRVDETHENGAKKENRPGWKFLRWVLLGGKPGAGMWDVMRILGKEEVERRFEEGVQVAREVEEEKMRE